MKLLLLLNILASSSAFVSVKTEEGELIGKTYTLDNNREVYAFLGVPYADPPIGNNRFKEPKKLSRWFGSKLATSQGNICKQKLYTPGRRGEQIGNEDCLYLNVFTPKLPDYNMMSEKQMNVMVYIHGGAFMFATGNEAYPDYLMRNADVVFVSFNYRVGPLGFFSMDDPAVPSNNGLKDQVEALKWINRNIHYFGGNPSKVTIYGCSAGAASIHYHMISPLSKGLFQSAISSSGSVLVPWALPPNVVRNSLDLATSLSCRSDDDDDNDDDDDIEKIMECMRRKPADEIIEKGYKYEEEGHLTILPFGPVIEPRNRGAFLLEDPYKLLKAGKVRDVPWMIGFVENEGSFLAIEIATNQTYMDLINENWNKMAPQIFSYDQRSKSEQNRISSLIKKKYFKDKPLTDQNVKRMFQAVGDRHIFCGGMAATKLHTSATTKNAFCYKFYYRGAESASDFYPNNNKKNFGVCHSDDLSYIVKYGDGKKNNKNDSDMTKLLISSIIAFMETGNPSTSEIEWDPIPNHGPMDCLVIYSYTYQRMENIENRENNKFWKNLDACEKPH